MTGGAEVPRATYRLQFSSAFRFGDAARIAPYLADLGVSHVYASPIFAARPGSSHGYDVIDHGRFNPELGSEDDFRAMVGALRAAGLGLILDIVPNHTGVWGSTNLAWLDVLERGADSRWAGWFDIDWEAPWPGLGGKLLAPVLGDRYAAALADGAMELQFDAEAGSFAVWAHDTHKLPLAPATYADILPELAILPDEDVAARQRAIAVLARTPDGAKAIAAALDGFRGVRAEAGSWDRLAALIARQHWLPVKFSLDREAINYRRFFTISDLAGLRVERPEVFDLVHALPLRLVAEGLVDGLRIDHIDGLRDPKAYCMRLRDRAARPFHFLVEKILGPDEELPVDWGTDGTTGYEFANLLVGLLVDPAGETAMTDAYRGFAGFGPEPAEMVRAAKTETLDGAMAAEREAVVRRLFALAQADPATRDLGRDSLRAALTGIVAALAVYRTYADADGLRDEDRRRIEAAVTAARRPGLDHDAVDFVAAALTLDLAGDPAAVRDVALRLQQLSGPVMAKGLEDCALYRFNRLIALNEVGSEPGRYSVPPAAFHRANAARQARWPATMLTTSTHDTKRGEDARARIAVLPAHAADWAEAVAEWHAQLPEGIDRNDAWFFFQLLFGAWPMAWRPGVVIAPAELDDFRARVQAAMLKSVREAGVRTGWIYGDAGYEAAMTAYVDAALDPNGAVLAAFRAFEATVAGEASGLALVQAALKLTLPGVPDLYQGAELWEQSLVDPDNRRPVDFDLRAAMLAAGPVPGDPTSPATKLHLTMTLLRLRRAHPVLFAAGSYEPLAAEGQGAERLCAFAREHGGKRLLVLTALAPARDWRDTRFVDAVPGESWREVLRGEECAPSPALLGPDRPVAVFMRA